MSQSLQSYSPCPTCYHPHRRRCAHRHPPHSCRAHHVVLIASCSSCRAHRVVRIVSCSSRRAHRVVRIVSCSSRRAHRVVLIASCSSCRAHCVVLIASCSSGRAQHIMSYLPTFLCFRAKCGSSIYRCTLDRMNRTGLSHYAWNLLRVCECNKSICYDVPCLDRQRDRGAMTRVVRMPFALTRLYPEGKCSDTAASRRKMP